MAKKSTALMKIRPEPNRYHDNFLDVIGTTFKFDHPKGLAEWMKNSADAYSTSEIRDDEQYILLRFKLVQPKSHSEFECIDFVGCTKRDIDDAMKVWGSPDAAKKGTNKATLGGHGNGGKFYMRQMFNTAQIITYKNGVANIFGFDPNHRYGFAKTVTEKRMPLVEALKLADIDSLEIPTPVKRRWKDNPKHSGFSVVRGLRPTRFSGRSTLDSILEGIRFHPQARRLLRHKKVIVVEYGNSWGTQLTVPSIDPKIGFEKPREILLPKHLHLDGDQIPTKGAKLVLRTSDAPLSGTKERASLNTIDVIGELGCIGSYRMNELGFMRHASESEFIYGECECEFLEAKTIDSVSNDREKLIPNDLTRELLGWIREQVDALASEIGDKREHEKKSRDFAQSSLFNQMLDKWKNRFMERMNSELFGGNSIGDTFGGAGAGGSGGSMGSLPAGPGLTDPNTGIFGDGLSLGSSGGGNNGFGPPGQEEERESGTADQGDNSAGPDGDGSSAGKGTGVGGGGGNQRRHTSKFPRVLLSGYDIDPLDPDGENKVECDPRHPPVYQRPIIDVENGIYWINTRRTFAEKILSVYGSKHPRWREYLFQRYVDIILKQQIHNLAKHNSEFRADDVDELVDRVTALVHDAAANDLEQFLFEDNLTGSAASNNHESDVG